MKYLIVGLVLLTGCATGPDKFATCIKASDDYVGGTITYKEKSALCLPFWSDTAVPIGYYGPDVVAVYGVGASGYLAPRPSFVVIDGY